MQSIGKMLESCKNGGPATPQNTYSRKATPTTFLSLVKLGLLGPIKLVAR